jgi:hypothetical protein
VTGGGVVGQVCLRTRGSNGGLIELSELKRHLEKKRKGEGGISEYLLTSLFLAVEICLLGTNSVFLRRVTMRSDDIERAIKKLKELGEGFDIFTVGSTKMVRALPLISLMFLP